MADEVVGRAIIEVDVDGASAAALLAKLRADAARAMADIDRMEGNAKIDADKRPLEKAIAEARREVLSLEKAKAEVAIDADTSALDRKLAKAKLKVKELNQEKIELKVDTDEIRDANKQLELTQKREKAAEDAALKRAKAQATTARQRERQVNSEQRALDRMGKAQSRALAEDARMAEQRSRMQARSLANGRKEIDQTIKGRAELAKLRQEYGKTLGTVQQIQKTTGRPGGIFRSGSETRDLEAASAKLRTLEHDIHRLGGAVDDIDPSLERHQGVLSRWASGLASTTVRIGPFTASLKQLATASVVLGPVLTGLGGGITSLIGVLGTGLAGGVATGTAALGGFILTAAGIGMVLKPAISEFNEANKATQAYSKAVLKYGKNSDQAKTAQEQMNHVLAGISPNAQQAARGWANMKTKWSELTASTKGDVLGGINQSIRTANALLPTFAHQTTASTKVASKAWEGWMTSLRSSEAKQLLGQTMAGFRDAIPGIAGGLASLGAAFGRVAASASKLLPGLTSGFAEWANGLEASIGRGAGLDAGLDRIIGHMRDLGHLAQSSGSLLTNLFNSSADSGDDLVKSLTRVTDKWNSWVKSAEGQEKLDSFFGEAADETEKLGGMLSRFTAILFQVGRATAPLSNGFLDFATALGDVVQAITSIAPLRGVMTGLGAVLGGLWVAGKVKAFSGAIRDAGMALKGLAASNALLGASESVGSGGFLARLFGRGGAKAATAQTAGLARGLGGLGIAAEGAAAGAGLMSSSLMLLVPPVAIAGLAYLLRDLGPVTTEFTRARDAFRETARDIPSSIKSVVAAGNEYNSSLHHQASATQTVADARRRLIKLQSDGAPMAKQLSAIRELTAAERQQVVVSRQSAQGRVQSVQGAKDMLHAAEGRVAAAKQMVKAVHEENAGKLDNSGGGVLSWKEVSKSAAVRRDLAKATGAVSHAQAEAADAARELAVANIPLERQVKGLAPISQQAEASLRQLSNTIGAAATKKVGKFVDPQDVEQVAKLGNRLTKLGQGSTVKKISLKSSGADETINKLQRVQKQSTRISGQTAKLNIKTNDSGAQQKLTRLGQLSQKVTGGRNTIRILANSSSAEQAIQRLQGNLRRVAQAKYQAKIDAIDRTTAPGSQARAHLTSVAQRKYQARLEAIDNTSAPSNKAKGNADKFARGSYRAKLMADPGQALGAISSVSAQLAALDGKTAQTKIVNTTENVTITKHKGGASGGPASGLRTTAYAGGGEPKPSSYVQQRAGERAIEEPAGRSRRVQTPRYLVGEESGHPEYVIATNPAYRESNERYLNSAADDLGYELVPAYAKGKGGGGGAKKSSGKKGKGGGDDKDDGPGPAPYQKQNKKHWTVHKHRFAPDSVTELNTTERQLENEEGKFNAELTRQEQEVAHKKRSQWDFGALKGYLQREQSMEKKIIQNLIPSIVSASNKAYTQSSKELKGPLSAQNVHAAQKAANTVAKEYSTMKAPTQGKDEKDGAFAKRKKQYEHAKKVKKAEAKEAANYAKRLAKERTEAQKMKEDAQQELTEVRQEVRVEHETALKELETEETGISDIEQNPSLAPYYEEPEKSESAAAGGGGPEGPTIGEQTASLGSALSDLSRQFSSNVVGSLLPSAPGGPAPGLGGMGGSPASPNYLPGSPGRYISGPGSVSSGGTSAGEFSPGGSPSMANGTVSIVNNFAAPPPDPHTWTAGQAFELGAL